jgi:hypothetical protein
VTIEHNDPIITRKRTGLPDNPFQQISEPLQVDGTTVVLTELPDSFNRVRVTGEGVTWIEIQSGLPSENEYLVNYKNKIVTFHESRNGLQLQFDYFGAGLQYVPTSMVYTQTQNGEVVETLKQLTDQTTEARDSANEASDTLNHKGTYSSTTQYKKRNIVNYSGNSYMALQDVLGIVPTDDTKWKKLSGFAFKNAYSNTTAYEHGDYVTDGVNEEIYMSLVDGNIGNPLSNLSKWKLVVSVKQALIDVRDATADARSAEDAAIDATVNANLSAENADSRASYAQLQGDHAKTQGDYAKAIGDNLQHKGDYSNAIAYKKNNVVWYAGSTWICIQDTSPGVLPTQASYWRVISNETTTNNETWTAIENQTVFNLTNGNYIMGDGHLKVWVGGVPQYVGLGFTETSDTSFTLTEGVPAGIQVHAEWFEGAITVYRGHTSSHESGGNDEIDASKLKNYKPYHVGTTAPTNKLSMWIDTSS